MLASSYSPFDSGGGLACTGRSFTGHYGWTVREVASFSLPCFTKVRLYVRGYRPVIATVLDRGPAPWTGRSLDISVGAVRAMGFNSAIAFGVRPVQVTVLRRR